jgi:hypothetical protein
MFGLGATLSNFLGQTVVEQYSHVASLTGSLVLSVIPIIIFGCFMPETLGDRGAGVHTHDDGKAKSDADAEGGGGYVEMN